MPTSVVLGFLNVAGMLCPVQSYWEDANHGVHVSNLLKLEETTTGGRKLRYFI